MELNVNELIDGKMVGKKVYTFTAKNIKFDGGKKMFAEAEKATKAAEERWRKVVSEEDSKHIYEFLFAVGCRMVDCEVGGLWHRFKDAEGATWKIGIVAEKER